MKRIDEKVKEMKYEIARLRLFIRYVSRSPDVHKMIRHSAKGCLRFTPKYIKRFTLVGYMKPDPKV